jgi:hypothetical protein
MRNYIFVLLILNLASCANISNKNPIRTTGIYTGKYKELVEAIKKEDLTAIEKIAKSNHLKLNYADSVNGVSLLNWCIFNEKEKSFWKLLQMGASPNWQDTACKFAAAITEGARLDNTSIYLKLAMQYNGDVNLLSKKLPWAENPTPLFGAIFSKRMENVKMLVENKADVNLSQDSMWSPLAETLVQGRIEMTQYLLEHGADYNKLEFKTSLGKKLNILDFLRGYQFSLGSQEYKIKMQVAEYLKAKGLSYWAYPIPDDVKNQHKVDTEYLSKY